MYNYIMLVMGAIDEDRSKEWQNRQGTKSRELLKKEQNMSALARILGEDPGTASGLGGSNTGKKTITIEVTPEDMKRAKKEREERQQAIKERRLGVPKKKNDNNKRSSFPTGTKPSSSSRK